MLAYRTPGVYFQWSDSRSHALTALRTDIAGFVGIAVRGPLHRPLKVENWMQFVSVFGAPTPQGYLGYAVQGFFANGGRECWIVRVADPDVACPAWCVIEDQENSLSLTLEATSPGTWGRGLPVRLQRVNADLVNLTLSLANGPREFWPNVSFDPDHERFLGKIFASVPIPARLVRISDKALDQNEGKVKLEGGWRLADGYFVGGADGVAALTVRHMSGTDSPPDSPWGLQVLEAVDEVSIVAMPDIMPKPETISPHQKEHEIQCSVIDAPQDAEPVPPPPSPEFPKAFSPAEIEELQQALIAHCEKLKDRFAILDPLPGDVTPQQAVDWRRKFDSKYAALYFPGLKVPLEHGAVLDVPPCGHVAGVYARTDLSAGVHKAPANTALEQVSDVIVVIDDDGHADLHLHQINALRAFAGRGIRMTEAVTLSSDSLWRYVSVRRLVTMIEEAIDEQTQWAVFEPNNPSLLSEISRVIRQFLNGLWQRGMLDGASPKEAYYVRGDETTTPPTEADVGKLICEVGVQPPWPAEFIVVHIVKIEGRTDIMEG